MRTRPDERAQFLRPPGLVGVEALHATFVTHRYAPHVHAAWTIAHVVSGAARFELEAREHLVGAGSVFVIPPGAVHTGESAGRDGYTYRVLYLDSQALTDSTLSETDRWRQIPVVLEGQALVCSLVRMHRTLSAKSTVLNQGEVLCEVLTDLLDALAVRLPEMPTTLRTHPAVATAREYILEHWREDFTLGELARRASTSPFHLLHRFRDEVGMPPSAYRRALRVQAAQRLLREGTPPAQAALDCGFYDQSHLNRHFKRATGVTPARYAAAGL